MSRHLPVVKPVSFQIPKFSSEAQSKTFGNYINEKLPRKNTISLNDHLQEWAATVIQSAGPSVLSDILILCLQISAYEGIPHTYPAPQKAQPGKRIQDVNGSDDTKPAIEQVRL
jgi:hypothetical protein